MNRYVPAVDVTADVAVDCVDDVTVTLDELVLSSRKKENKKIIIVY